jgi:hypothetical protein
VDDATGQKLMFDVRMSVCHLQRLDLKYYANPVGRLMTRVTSTWTSSTIFTSGVVTVFGDCSRSSASWS